jgi:hypothetical protein
LVDEKHPAPGQAGDDEVNGPLLFERDAFNFSDLAFPFVDGDSSSTTNSDLSS